MHYEVTTCKVTGFSEPKYIITSILVVCPIEISAIHYCES